MGTNRYNAQVLEENVKKQVLSDYLGIDIKDIEQIRDDTFYCLAEGQYYIVDENEADVVLTCIINDMIESQKDQITYDLKRSNLEYILKFVDVDSYYDNVCYGMDLTDFEWEDIYSEFGLFYIKRL